MASDLQKFGGGKKVDFFGKVCSEMVQKASASSKPLFPPKFDQFQPSRAHFVDSHSYFTVDHARFTRILASTACPIF